MRRDQWSVDLHSHTLYSDGSQSPEALLLLAKANGVRVLSITDHDHTGGIDEALRVGEREGLEIIPGIELSVAHAEFEDIHVLGYYFAWHAPRLEARLAEFRDDRDTRAERILARINEQLLGKGRAPIEYAAVKARVKGAFGRPHIANVLIEQGHVPDMNAAFHEYLVPYNVPKPYFSAKEALVLMRDVRGISVVAHPGLITPDRLRLSELLNELRALGLVGIETYHNDHNPEDTLYFARTAEQLGMIVTGGSDYHGFKHRRVDHNAGGRLGALKLPYSIAERLRQEYLVRYPLALLLLDWPVAASATIRHALTEHYKLELVNDGRTDPIVNRAPSLLAEGKSLIVDMQSADVNAIEGIVATGRQLDVRTVGVPWEASRLQEYVGLYQTPPTSPQRFQRTPVERLAHELLHQVILAQLH